MEDNLSAEDTTVLGKRSWSASNLVPSIPPSATAGHENGASSSHEDSTMTDDEPAAKRHFLPPKPPVAVPGHSPLSTHDRPTSLEQLPPGVLQRIFSFLPLHSLQCLLHVSSLCRALLVPACSLPTQPDGSKDLPLVPQDTLWKGARMRYFPGMPRPLAGHSEYDSFMLILNRSCQFCAKLPPLTQSHRDPYKAGPGLTEVRIIWPFRIRSCSACLETRIKEETQVFLSDASPFRTGLPFVSLTPEMDFVPVHLLLDSDKPRDLVVEKYFYIPHIDEILKEAEEARSYTQAAAENWIKGLESRRRELMKDCARFEKWDNPRNLDLIRRRYNSVQNESKPSSPEGATATAAVTRHPLVHPQASDVYSVRSLPTSLPLPDAVPDMPLRDYGMAPGQEPDKLSQTKDLRPTSAGTLQQSAAAQTSAHERERARISAGRRDEIFRRSAELDPPIDVDTLTSMDAFQATMLIVRPLSDVDWATLKTRLLKEQGKLDTEQDLRDSVIVAPVPGEYNATEKPDQYVLTHLDQPIRDKLVDIADDFIRHRWNFGSFVDWPNAPQFAAEVLVHVRAAYVRLKQREDAMRLQQLTPSVTTSTEDRVLRLEHMKWVFNKTIQPRTEQIRSDLFLCGECPATTSKFYAFDSVIQHYASKHTDAFSRGTQKVYWKAEWPEKPPFNTHPERAHTPVPALTHTPTLSNAQLEQPSPATLRHAPPSNVDWRSRQSAPTDSGSMTSHNADSLSYASTGPPGTQARRRLYDVQREMFTDALALAWLKASQLSRIPRSLQLFIALQEAHDAFTQKYTNHPSLSLLSDCVRRKSELQGIKMVSDLRCRECLQHPSKQDLRSYSLQSLIEHFQSIHMAELHDGQKLHWWLDMVDLPSPDTIREVQRLPEMAPSFHKALQEALLVALSAPQVMATAITASIHAPNYSRLEGASGRAPRTAYSNWPLVTGSERPPFADARLLPESASQTLVDSASLSRRQSGFSIKQRGANPDLDSVHSSVSSLPKRPLSRTDLAQDKRPRYSHSTFDTQAEYIALTDTPADTPPRATQVSLLEADPMTRSNTVLLETPLTTAQAVPVDATSRFLADFETVVGADDQNSMGAGSSARHSRPESTSETLPVSRALREEGGSTALEIDVAAQHGVADRPYEAHWPETSQEVATARVSYDPDPRGVRESSFGHAGYPEEPRELQRAPSRFVEYDDRGLPIQTQERRYYPISPRSQAYPVTYVDRYGQPVELLPRREVQYMEVPARQTQYINDPYYEPRRYQPVEYVRVQAYEDERMLDHSTGQYVVEDPHPRSRIIELDTVHADPRPAHLRRPPARSTYRQVQQTSGPAEARQQVREPRYPHAGGLTYDPSQHGSNS